MLNHDFWRNNPSELEQDLEYINSKQKCKTLIVVNDVEVRGYETCQEIFNDNTVQSQLS